MIVMLEIIRELTSDATTFDEELYRRTLHNTMDTMDTENMLLLH